MPVYRAPLMSMEKFEKMWINQTKIPFTVNLIFYTVRSRSAQKEYRGCSDSVPRGALHIAQHFGSARSALLLIQSILRYVPRIMASFA